MLSIFTKQKNWLFLLLLIGISFYYDYHHIVFKPSQGIHQWRQTDGASFARNYYMEGMKFFQPKTHNLTSDGGKTSYAATADTPFLYYSVAILYKIFGYHEFIYRLLNTLIFLTGLFYLFRAFYLLFEDEVWASAIALLAFSSPVLVYYASNFIPDSTALSMVFIAFYHFINYWKNSGTGSLIWMMFFFFLAGSLKITALITYIAISFLFLLEWTGWISFPSKKIFQHKKLFIFGTIISTGLVFAWVFYASWFNRIHECSYFSTTIFPIWRMDTEGIRFILTSVKNNWIRDYYHYSVYIIAALSFVYFCFNFKKIPPVFRLIFPVLLILGISFLLLQFTLLKDHDYYVINLYIIPIILLGTVVYSLKQYYPTLFSSVYLKFAMIIFVVFNIWYSGKNLDNRYNGEDNLRKLKANDFYEITPYLRELGLNRESRVISIPGRSHINLYLMDQKGWTQFTDHKLHRGKEFYYYNRDREGILKSIETVPNT